MDQSDQLNDACLELYSARSHLRKVLSFIILDDEGRDDVYIYDLEGCAQVVRDALDFIKNDAGMTLPHIPETPENGETREFNWIDTFETPNPLRHIPESEKRQKEPEMGVSVDAPDHLKETRWVIRFTIGPEGLKASDFATIHRAFEQINATEATISTETKDNS
jgi:hypothetical protein